MSWSLNKTVVGAILYALVLLFTWKFQILGATPLNWKFVITITSPVAIVAILYMNGEK